LVVKKGAGHGWPYLEKDVATLADEFDRHLLHKPTASAAPAPAGSDRREGK
jgi:hypothetical protein